MSTLCFGLVTAYVLASLAATGLIEVGGPGFEVLFVFPGLVGLPAVAVGALTALMVRGTWMGRGQLLSLGLPLVLGAGLVVSGVATTGWELVLVPVAMLPGQVVAAVGLWRHRRDRRHRLRLSPGVTGPARYTG